MDRDFLHRGAAVSADIHCGERRYGMARDAHLRESTDIVPDAAVRLGAVLSSRRRTAAGDDRRYLPRHRPLCGDATHRARSLLLLSRCRIVVAEDNRLVNSLTSRAFIPRASRGTIRA